MTDEFFDIIDSHPMSDEEASERFKKIHPQNLPCYEEYYKAKSEDRDWNIMFIDYDNYTGDWSALALKLISSNLDDHSGPKWNADKRKSLVELESRFSSIGEYWAATLNLRGN